MSDAEEEVIAIIKPKEITEIAIELTASIQRIATEGNLKL
jgi:hypothetical protein